MLDFADPSSKLSVKNVQLVLATDDSLPRKQDRRSTNRRGTSEDGKKMAWYGHSGNAPSHPRGWKEVEEEEEEEENGWYVAGNESTLLSFGKSDRDSFFLDFRWPLTPMQAFGLALAALDTSI